MRRFNAILGPVIIMLLLIHGVTGALQLTGIISGGSTVRAILSYVMAAAVALHILIGIKLTADTMLSCIKSGTPCIKGNGEFWARRISGLALILFIIWHMFVYMSSSGAVFRLHSFGIVQLIAHIFLVLSLILHLALNIKPLFIALGIGNRKYIRDIIIILTIVMCVCAAAFVFYYLRWNVLWKWGA